MMQSAKQRGYDNGFYRSHQRRIIAGVCGGLAERMGWSVTGVRLGWVVMFMFTGAFAVMAYLAAIILLASRPSYLDETQLHRQAEGAEAMGGRVRQLRHRLAQLDQRLRGIEQYVTSKQFEFDQKLRRR